MRISDLSRGLSTALLLGLPISLAAQNVEMTIPNLPASVQPGEFVSLVVDFEKDAGVDEQRLVFVMEVRDASNNDVVESVTLDNSGQGYKGQSGSIGFSFFAPEEIGGIYFNIHAAPWSLNRWITEQFRSYPTDGTWTYLWDSSFGVTQDIYYLGTLIAPKPSANTTYCSGVAFEAAIIAYLDYNDLYGHPTIGGMTAFQMGRFRHMWYGTRVHEPDPDLKLAALAIPQYGIGVEITDWEEVQEGDFVQLWRHSGSGHNPIFVSWIRNASGTITGMNYWGSQPSTNGIGFRSEFFGSSGSSMDRDRTYFGRIAKPRDKGDIDFAIDSISTQANVTTVQMGLGTSWTLY